jgi:CheY-like chemotaxis protein
MQLHYNILWIDNDIDDYISTGEVDSIKTFLLDLGFEPTIITIDDEEKLEDKIHILKYDLIISDFNLNYTTGDVIIKQIRDEKKFSTEILFYSAKTNFRNDPEVLKRLAFMDRITFHTGRETLLRKIETLIELTLDKLLELNATRGLITSATSELDVNMELIAHKMIDKINQDECEKIFSEIHSEIFNKQQENITNLEKLFKEKNFKEYFTKADAYRKWDLLKDILKQNSPMDFDQKLFKRYHPEVIDIRNKFAHAKAKAKEDGSLALIGQYGKADFEFDSNACIKIRQDLIKHRKNFSVLCTHLDLNQD